jgi:hypothetical protein
MYHHPPHRDNVTAPHWHPSLRSRLHLATTGRGDHEVLEGHVVALKEINISSLADTYLSVECVYYYYYSKTGYCDGFHANFLGRSREG